MKRSKVVSGQWSVGSGQSALSSDPPSALRPPPLSRSPRAFTLTELLVVITIIGMLVGLLVPALIAARGRARVTQCTNNQKELGLAILQFEMAKQRFPGYANLVGGRKVSWIPVLFPYLGRMDLWEGNESGNPKIYGWRTGNPSRRTSDSATVGVGVRPRISQLVCPDDSPSAPPADTPDTPLSYVVNVGGATAGDAVAANQTGVFRNLAQCPATLITMSSIKSPSRRPMISERTFPLNASSPPVATEATRRWGDVDAADGTNNTAIRLGFMWPSSGLVTSALPSIHRGIVIVTFCDGHTDSLADNVDCSVYDWSLPIL